jgi:uncharacterized protein (TIGR02145 family)
MKTREKIHQKLNNLFFSELANNLAAPLIKKVSCFNRGDFNNRFDLRVATDENQLGNWWRHPIYIIAKPSAENVVINITIQPQRWPEDVENYANEHKDIIDQKYQEINDLIKSHSINTSQVKQEIKTESKFVLSYSLSVTIDKANPSEADYLKFITFLTSLCQITVSLSDALPIGEDTSKLDEADISWQEQNLIQNEEMNMDEAPLVINFEAPYCDYHLVSQDYEITPKLLETWTLGRIKIPDFPTKEAMKDWIIAMEYLITMKRMTILGASYKFFSNWPFEEYSGGNYYNYDTKSILIDDVNGNSYTLPARHFYEKQCEPSDLLDTNKLFEYLSEEKNQLLDCENYGSYSSTSKTENNFLFEQISMCGLAEFLYNLQPIKYTAKNAINPLPNSVDLASEDDFNETNVYWKFKDLKENNNVFVIECKYFDDAKKASILEYFDSWRMWHEKFIKNNTMYFVIFQTDEIHDANLDEYFSILTNEISKRYSINSYSTDLESYIQKKSEINSTQKSEINTTKDIIASIKNENKRVYLFCISIYSNEDIQIVTEQIFEKIHLIKNFIKTNIDDNVNGFLFEEFHQSYKLAKSLKNKSIDDPDFKEFIMQLLQKYTQTDFNGCFEFEFNTSFIFDLTSKINEVGFIDVWNEKFLELSAEVDETITVYGYHEVYEDIIYQMYDHGEWETGLIATVQGYYDWPLSSYIRSEAGWEYPKESIFDLTTYMKKSVITNEENMVSKKEFSHNEIVIGQQVWSSKNLNVDKFRNGDPIPELKNNDEWQLAGRSGNPAWCYYNYDPANGEKYGKLYNWYAISDSRGFAPEGWHIPTEADWTTLIDYLGGSSHAGKKMQTTVLNWSEGTNESGFSGLPSGEYDGSEFTEFGESTSWWSSTDTDIEIMAQNFQLDSYGFIAAGKRNKKYYGLSVRCLKD